MLVTTRIRMIGRIARHLNSLSFSHDHNWLKEEDRFPISVSMPLTSQEHGDRAIDCFLWGLLPDNGRVLDQWGKRFQVSARSSYGLIKNVGQDCAGAVQFIPRDDEEEFLREITPGKVTCLTDAELQDRMNLLLKDHSISRTPDDAGQFSLAGAQPKTALYLDKDSGKWGVPSGSIPTTHILKPAQQHFDGHAENESFCLSDDTVTNFRSTAHSSHRRKYRRLKICRRPHLQLAHQRHRRPCQKLLDPDLSPGPNPPRPTLRHRERPPLSKRNQPAQSPPRNENRKRI
jgi:HipA-like protein